MLEYDFQTAEITFNRPNGYKETDSLVEIEKEDRRCLKIHC